MGTLFGATTKTPLALPAGSDSADTEFDGPFNLNTATAAQLARVAGIGLELGSRTVSYRVLHGDFVSVDRLGEVPGLVR